MKNNIRKPAVAGRFYPSSALELTNQIESFLSKKADKTPAIGCMLPHAGYIYSGRVAVETVSRIDIPDRIIIIGPNHTGEGAQFSLQTEGAWLTPFGEIKINSEFAKTLLDNSEYLEEDSKAHIYEHSLEVELPILQYFKKTFEIVPICILSDDIEILKKIGVSIANTIRESGLASSWLIVASSDMTHYEPQGLAEKKDKEAIKAIIALDADRLTEKVSDLNITMCGYAPVSIMLTAAKILGAKKGELVKYVTSGDVTLDKTSVVGYAGVIIK